MIIVAYFYPTPGIQEGTFSISSLANYGISVIFFFYGLRLSPDKLKVGLTNWKLHFLIHFFTFIVFPALILLVYPLFKGSDHEQLWLGTFYLAALPGTVSSAVVMVSIAGGNIPASIFNASISSLLGIFITPLWMSIFLTEVSGDFEILGIFGKLIIQVLLPVVFGILLNSKRGTFAERNKTYLKYFDQMIILLIVYSSFSESFAKRMFDVLRIADIVVLGIAMVALFFLVYFLIGVSTKFLSFSRADSITALFCGSKKSLVQGTVMSKVLFTNVASVGILLLPIMLYHALQLLIASIIAQTLSADKQKN
jgi:solute carrier family 10 (sodium/bile acid cotransporter), member 7